MDRAWSLIGAGFLMLCGADCIYLLQVAGGATDASLLGNVFYMGATALLALAAWQPRSPGREDRLEGTWVLLIPSAFALCAVALLIVGQVRPIGVLAEVLANATLLAALARTVLTFRDLRALAETRHQAHTDELTGLPNRRLFFARVQEEIASSPDGTALAVLLVDLDHFKELNDTLGHRTGDRLLAQIGPRLRSSVREGDTVARLGGDEFGILLPAPMDELRARQAAARVRWALTQPFLIDELHLQVVASVGVALYPDHGASGDELLQRADVAMYEAKGRRSGQEVYARERDHHSRAGLELVGQLPAAFAAGELEAFFQPKADAGSRAVVGFEALVRWRHPEHGLLAPAAFVPLAEQAGLARQLTRCVLEQALAACRGWRADGHDLHVAVNASVSDLLDTSLPGEIHAALLRHGLPPEALVLELTEGSVMSDPTRIGEVLERLAALGVGLSLDDFGTGYSSLLHLKTLPVGEVKIDRSFVTGALHDAKDAAIVRATIDLARELGMRTVAEGVEDDAVWERLSALGCEVIQGYALSRPVPAAEAAALIAGADAPVSRARSAARSRA
jgi:diguanylate cyclase